MSSKFLEAALRYAELGYPVFPCVPGGKEPLTENGFKDATLDEDLIFAWWERWPEANVAIPTEGLLVVDIDGKDNPWLASDAEKLMDLTRGPVGLTPRGGSHRVFRQPEGKSWRNTTGKLAERVDTRANGGYIVVAPSNLETGGGYRWAPGLELDSPRESLPLPPEWLVKALDGETVIFASERTSAVVPSNLIPDGQRNSTLAKLAGSMRRNGMSPAEIRAALQETNITRCKPPLEPIEVDRIVASITRYAPDQVAVAMVEDHWSQIFQEPIAVDAPADPGPFPEELIYPGGLLEKVIRFNLEGAFKPQPVLALAGAISLLGTITGRKVADASGIRTNIYCLGVCDSGGGKERARQVNKQILYDAAMGKLIGPEGIASHAGLVNTVAEQPTILFQLDEIGRFLQTLGNPNSSPHLYHVVTVLMKLFTSANSIYIGDAYADTKQTKQIYQPNACLYGTTVPKSLYEGLTTESITDGFLSRMLIFESNNPDPEPRTPEQVQPSRELIGDVCEWGAFTPGGNLSGENPQPAVFTYTPDAEQRLAALEEVTRQERQKGEEFFPSLWTRTAEKARKLALIHACSLFGPGGERTIPLESVEWGCQLSEYLTRKLASIAHEWVSENHFERQRKRVLRVIKSHSPISRSELARKTKSMTAREREEVVSSLEQTGEILRKKEATGGAPREVYEAACHQVAG